MHVWSSPVSPRDWGLSPVQHDASDAFEYRTGLRLDDVDARCRHVIDDWLPHHWDDAVGAFHGYYDPRSKHLEPPQLVNLIAPWLVIAAYDRGHDESLLARAKSAAEWLHSSELVISHPMSIAVGGVREPGRREAWSKYAAEYVLLNLALDVRCEGTTPYRERAVQSGLFLVQAARHDLAVKFHEESGSWDGHGWQAFGRMIEALLALHHATDEEMWRDRAIDVADRALRLQQSDGCFCLINGEYYSSDLAADPIRGLTAAWQETGDEHYLTAALRFADWHIERQRDDGAWIMTVDSDGNVVCPTVGPGDVPNIATAFLMLHDATADERYLESAIEAFRYTMSVQIVPGAGAPYENDPAMQWGFWSWMPHYDFTVSADQATHHVRGLYFLIDYLATLDAPPER